MAHRSERFGDDGPIVGVAWLRAHLTEPGVRVVDARPWPQYAAGHLPGAYQSDLHALKLTDSAPEALNHFDEAVESELRRLGVQAGERVVFYEDFSGSSAARGVWLLDYAGLAGGALLDGGLSAWRAAGGEIIRDVPPTEPSEVRIRPDRSVLATADELVAPQSGSLTPLPLDTRNHAERAAGTIPGSVHLEWMRHLRPDGSFRSPDELRRLYTAGGVEPAADRDIVAYCASGSRAAQAYVVLRALGYPRVKNYAPSWNEWGQRPDFPIEYPDDA